MRTAYEEQLNLFSQDLVLMADCIIASITASTHSLLHCNLSEAERVLGGIDEVEELRLNAEETAFSLLALQAPVAKDLRRVITGQRMIESFIRMATLSRHIAKLTRLRHPEPAIPPEIAPYIAEMSRVAITAAKTVRQLLVDTDVATALQLAADDDAVDDIHSHLLKATTGSAWAHGTRAAVDVAAISRYLERFSDHTVTIGERMVYLVTGMTPDEYREKKAQDSDDARLWAEFEALSRRYSEGGK